MSLTERFTGRAGAYVAGRPTYPEAALDALFDGLATPRAELVAVDLGAGTGISTRLLAARAATVIAIEPNADMRAAAPPQAGVRWIDGTGEATGLPDASADLVAAFQAFHWFDAEVALREMVRVLRPGGRAAVVYNERDHGDPFTAAYGALVRASATDATETRREDALRAFATWNGWARTVRTDLPSAQRLDRAGLHARARSTSYLPADGPAAEALHAAIDALYDAHAANDGVTLALLTTVVVAEPAR